VWKLATTLMAAGGRVGTLCISRLAHGSVSRRKENSGVLSCHEIYRIRVVIVAHARRDQEVRGSAILTRKTSKTLEGSTWVYVVRLDQGSGDVMS
jgi:pyridoxal/pyridoxine/pyridoxamine kinase